MAFKLGDLFPRKIINEPGLSLDDLKWAQLEGGYRKVLYDASAALKGLEQAHDLKAVGVIYEELWNELHHQGDVGLASYYAVPHLVRIAREKQLADFNVLGLVTVIEIQRHKAINPPLPKALKPLYQEAITGLLELAQIVTKHEWDIGTASSVLAAIALAKGQLKLAEAILNLDDESQVDEFLETYT